MIYGLFRLVRAYIYWKEFDDLNDDPSEKYGEYES